MRRLQPLHIEEIGGDKFPSLEASQRAALAATVFDLADMIRALLASGSLIIQNGRIIPNPERTIKADE